MAKAVDFTQDVKVTCPQVTSLEVKDEVAEQKKHNTLILTDNVCKLLDPTSGHDLSSADVDDVSLGEILLSHVADKIQSSSVDVTEYKGIQLQLGAADAENSSATPQSIVRDYTKVITAMREKNPECMIIVGGILVGHTDPGDRKNQITSINTALMVYIGTLDSAKNKFVSHDRTEKHFKKVLGVYYSNGMLTQQAVNRLKSKFISGLSPFRSPAIRPKLESIRVAYNDIQGVLESQCLGVYPVSPLDLEQADHPVKQAYNNSIDSNLLLGHKPGQTDIHGFLYLRFKTSVAMEVAKQSLEKKNDLKVVPLQLEQSKAERQDKAQFQFLLSEKSLLPWKAECEKLTKTRLVCHSLFYMLVVLGVPPELTEDDIQVQFPSAVEVLLPPPSADADKPRFGYVHFDLHQGERPKKLFLHNGKRIQVACFNSRELHKKAHVGTQTNKNIAMIPQTPLMSATPKKKDEAKKADVPKAAKAPKESATGSKDASAAVRKGVNIDLSELVMPKKGPMDSDLKSKFKCTLNHCKQLQNNKKEKTAQEDAAILNAMKHCEKWLAEDSKRLANERKKQQPANLRGRGPTAPNPWGQGFPAGGQGFKSGGQGFRAGGQGFNSGGQGFKAGGRFQGPAGRSFSGGQDHTLLGKRPKTSPIRGSMSKMTRFNAPSFQGGDMAPAGGGQLLNTLEGLVSTLSGLFGKEQGQQQQPQQAGQPAAPVTNRLLSMSGTQSDSNSRGYQPPAAAADDSYYQQSEFQPPAPGTAPLPPRHDSTRYEDDYMSGSSSAQYPPSSSNYSSTQYSSSAYSTLPTSYSTEPSYYGSYK